MSSSGADLAGTYVAAVVVHGEGVDPSGLSDSTAGIQRVLDDAPTGAEVSFPAGVYQCTSTVTVGSTLHLRGPGAQLLFVAGVAGSAGVHVTADGVSIHSMSITTTVEGNQTGSKQFGVYVDANEFEITSCTMEGWQNGIAVSPFGEYANIRIIGNRVKDIVGAGDGPNDTASTNGEDRGDGIVVWGCQATVIGNIVNAKPGTDARIGIHTEALATDEGTANPPHPDAMVAIADNVVFGNFRRDIVSEQVDSATITGNTVADATWWGIAVSDANGVVIAANTVIWTRTAADQQGAAWSPVRAPFMLYGGAQGTTVQHNAARLVGDAAADAGIVVQEGASGCTVRGNIITNEGTGTLTNAISVISSDGIDIDSNTVSGYSTNGINGYAATNLRAHNNTITGPGAAAGVGGIILNGDSSATPVTIANNVIKSVALAINRSNSSNNVIVGNTIDAATTAISMYGCTNSTLSGNVGINVTNMVTNAAGAGIRNYDNALPAAAGKSTLAAGSASVANTSITAASIVRLSRQAASGALGELSVSLTPGTGFEINSASASDTSTVYWEVIAQ